MKVKLLLALNVEGRQYESGVVVDLPVKDAQALVRGRLAEPVKERAVPDTKVETRVAD